ncbi:TPA: hypothetical protein ACF5BV_004290 [Vibrio parahaemolyticus]|uniref:hypothetical protein n=1 Tax=Vibrio parahaemolyticus TaxID=670 RepID=UPI0030EFE8D8
MNKNHIPIWIIFTTSSVCLTLFGFLIGWNSKNISISEILATNTFTTLIGALTGAIFGSLGTHKISSMMQDKKVEKLKFSLYEEGKHIQGYLCSYLINLVKEHKAFYIDLHDEGAQIIGPAQIDFSVIKSLHLELIKENAIPSGDQRKLIHNLENHVISILEEDKQRFLIDGSKHTVNLNVSKNIMFRISGAIFHLQEFISDKDNFVFKNASNKEMISTAFSVSKINDADDLIEDLSRYI